MLIDIIILRKVNLRNIIAAKKIAFFGFFGENIKFINAIIIILITK
jgi:hypothetical protein